MFRVWEFALSVCLVLPVCMGQSLVAQADQCASRQCCSPFPCLCDPTPCGQRNWVNIEYQHYWLDGFSAPPLLTQSPAGTPRATAGVLNSPSTSLLAGASEIGVDSLSGMRIGFGHYIDDCGNVAITGSLFFSSGDAESQFPNSPDTIISRPFFNADPGVNAQDAELVNFPGDVTGTATIATDTDIFSGSLGLKLKLCCCADASCCSAQRIDAYFGYRTFRFDEDLTISEVLQPTGGFVPSGTQIAVFDSFRTENSFNGFEFGLLSSYQRQRWVFELGSRIALGNVNQQVTISGETTTSVPNVSSAVQPYGFLAAPSNIGTYDRDKFGVMTDTRLELGYWLSCRTKLRLGYNLLFLNSVVRPGSYVSTTLNSTQIDPNTPTTDPALPSFQWRDESLLLHGLSFGAEFRF